MDGIQETIDALLATRSPLQRSQLMAQLSSLVVDSYTANVIASSDYYAEVMTTANRTPNGVMLLQRLMEFLPNMPAVVAAATNNPFLLSSVLRKGGDGAAAAIGCDAKLIFDLVRELRQAKFAAQRVYVMQCLERLATNKNNHQALINAGVIDGFLNACQDDQHCIEIACLLLERLNFAIPSEYIPRLAHVADQHPQFAPRLLEIIYGLMQCDPGIDLDQNTLIRGLSAASNAESLRSLLSNLTPFSDPLADDDLFNAGFAAAQRVMIHFVSSKPAVVAGLNALLCFMTIDPRRMANACTELNLLELLSHCVAFYHDDDEIVRLALGLIDCILNIQDIYENMNEISSLVVSGGDFTRSSRIIAAVSHLEHYADNLVDASAVPVMLLMLQQYPDRVEQCLSAIRCQTNLLRSSSVACDQIAQLNGFKIVQNAVKHSPALLEAYLDFVEFDNEASIAVFMMPSIIEQITASPATAKATIRAALRCNRDDVPGLIEALLAAVPHLNPVLMNGVFSLLEANFEAFNPEYKNELMRALLNVCSEEMLSNSAFLNMLNYSVQIKCLDEYQQKAVRSKIAALLPQLNNDTATTALFILNEIQDKSTEYLFSNQKMKQKLPASLAVHSFSPLILSCLQQISQSSEDLETLLASSSAPRKRSALLAQDATCILMSDSASTLLSIARVDPESLKTLQKMSSFNAAIGASLKALAMGERTSPHQTALEAIAPLVSVALASELLDFLDKFSDIETFTLSALPILIDSIILQSGGSPDLELNSKMIAYLHRILFEQFPSEALIDQVIKLCEALADSPHTEDLQSDDRLINCLMTGSKRLGMRHDDILRVCRLIRTTTGNMSSANFDTISDPLLSFIAEGMLRHPDSVDIQSNGLEVLRIIVTRASDPAHLTSNAMLHYALDNAVEYHIMNGAICTNVLEIASFCKAIERTQFLQQHISEDDAFVLKSLPPTVRQKRDYGRVLEQTSKVDAVNLEFLMSALRLHGHNRITAKHILNILDETDPALILPIEYDLTSFVLQGWSQDEDLVEPGRRILARITAHRQGTEDQVLKQTLLDKDASFLITSLKAAPTNKRLATVALRILCDSNDDYLNATEIDDELSFLIRSHWGDDPELSSLGKHVLTKIRDSEQLIMEPIGFADTEESIKSLVTGIIETPEDLLIDPDAKVLLRLLQALNCYPDDHQLSRDIAQGIWRLTSIKASREIKNVWRGTGIVAIIRALAVHIENPAVLLWLCQILSLLSEDEHLKSLIGIHSGIPAVFKVVRRYSKRDLNFNDLQKVCIETVALVSHRNPANVAEIVQDNGIVLLVSLIDYEHVESELLVNVLVALTNVAQVNNLNKVKIVDQGGARVVALALNSSETSSDIIAIQITMRCIAHLAMIIQNADKLIEDNVVRIIATVCKTHLENVQISEQASQTMQNLSGCNDKSKDSMVRQKGAHTILSLWEAHHTNVLIVNSCLTCLHRLCSTMQSSAIPALICKLGGLDMLLRQSEGLLQKESLCAVSVQLLADLAFNEQVCTVLISRLIVQRVIQAAEKHPFEINIVKAVLRLIIVLASSSEELCIEVAKQGARDWPKTMMSMREDAVDLWSECMLCWTALAGSSQNVLDAMPFIDSVRIGLERFKHNVNFVKCGATLWSRLSMYPVVIKQMLEQKCVSTILLTMAEHSDAAFVVEKFVRTLTNMVTIEISSYSILLRERAPKLVKELASRHSGNKVTVKVCQKFLNRMDELAAMDAQIGSIRDRVPKDMLNMITAGSIFRKMPKGNRRVVSVSEDCQYLIWQDPKTSKTKSLGFCHVTEVRPGACTADLQHKSLVGRPADPAASFAIFSRRRKSALSLEAQNPEMARSWLVALELLQSLNHRIGSKEGFDRNK